MPDAQLGVGPMLATISPLRRDDPLPRLGLFSDLLNVVTWELPVGALTAHWHAPLARVLGDPGADAKFVLHTGAGAGPRELDLTGLATALVAPIVETVNAGVAWDNYELIHDVGHSDGTVRRVLVRAIPAPDSFGFRLLGVVADVTDPEALPWVSSSVAERLELLVEHSPDGIIVHQAGIIVYANPAAARFAGLSEVHDCVGKPMASFITREDIAPVVERLSQLREPGDAVKGHEVTLVRSDGSTLAVEIVSVRTTWHGEPAFQVIMRDVSERARAEEAARARRAMERRYAAAVAALEEGVIVMDRVGMVCAANDSAIRILGRRLRAGTGDDVFTGGTPALQANGVPFVVEDLPVAMALAGRRATTNVVVGITDELGEDQWLSVSARPIGVEDDETVGDGAAVVCSVSDITERKKLLDRLAWEARNDPLTGLANRGGFLAAVEEALSDPESSQDLVMFFFDLDRFKLVNDSLGHAMGDEVLLAVAERLRRAMPGSLSLSRLHGDEFAALETGVPDADAALQRAEELRTMLSRPIELSTGRKLTVTPSIGLVRLGDVGANATEILQDADMAMLQAKTRGRGRVAIFDAGLREEVRNRLELEHDLRVAVETGQLRLEYQPLASLTNGRCMGLEALVRWEHPERGLLMPGMFVSLAEESELIVKLGEWVLEAACTQMAQWRAEYPEARDSFLAVNVSPRQLDGSTLLPTLRDVLERTGLPPGALLLEITESALVVDDLRIHGLLNELRDFGVRLAIDDFGTGYSSLSYLKRLPVSYLKVDRSFVMGLGVDAGDERIVAAITELGHGLGLRVIAEGVEDRQQRDSARQLGCDLYQGFLLARPSRPRDVPPMFSAGR